MDRTSGSRYSIGIEPLIPKPLMGPNLKWNRTSNGPNLKGTKPLIPQPLMGPNLSWTEPLMD
jgi:hypothetical protein